MDTVWQYVRMWNIKLLYVLAILPLVTHLEKMRMYVYTNTHTQMFKTAVIHNSQKVEATQMPINC